MNIEWKKEKKNKVMPLIQFRNRARKYINLKNRMKINCLGISVNG